MLNGDCYLLIVCLLSAMFVNEFQQLKNYKYDAFMFTSVYFTVLVLLLFMTKLIK